MIPLLLFHITGSIVPRVKGYAVFAFPDLFFLINIRISVTANIIAAAIAAAVIITAGLAALPETQNAAVPFSSEGASIIR